MTDYLKAFPFVTIEDYKWKLNPCMMRLMSVDNTRIHYISEKKAAKKNAKTINSAEDLINDLGLPVSLLSKDNVKTE